MLARRKLVRLSAWTATLAAVVGLTVAATGMTGAYFTDTHSGTIGGTIGSIKVNAYGGSGVNNTDFTFANLLPGVTQSAVVSYTNDGANAEDVWLVFQNATALSALNNLGTYGEAHVVANGTHLFDSANLNDRASTCGPFSPSGCWPLPAQIKVADNVAPGHSGSVTFTFGYASKLKNPDAEGAPFNLYPIPGQTTVNAGDGSGSGLPYQIVATQVGQTP